MSTTTSTTTSTGAKPAGHSPRTQPPWRRPCRRAFRWTWLRLYSGAACCMPCRTRALPSSVPQSETTVAWRSAPSPSKRGASMWSTLRSLQHTRTLLRFAPHTANAACQRAQFPGLSPVWRRGPRREVPQPILPPTHSAPVCPVISALSPLYGASRHGPPPASYRARLCLRPCPPHRPPSPRSAGPLVAAGPLAPTRSLQGPTFPDHGLPGDCPAATIRDPRDRPGAPPRHAAGTQPAWVLRPRRGGRVVRHLATDPPATVCRGCGSRRLCRDPIRGTAQVGTAGWKMFSLYVLLGGGGCRN
jgi:hypothetical protein